MTDLNAKRTSLLGKRTTAQNRLDMYGGIAKKYDVLQETVFPLIDK
jgi:hypothetical protein